MSSENSIWLGGTGYFQLCRLGASVWLLRRIWIGLNPCLPARCIISGRTLLVSACWRVRVEAEFRACIVHGRKRRLEPLPDKARLDGQRLEPYASVVSQRRKPKPPEDLGSPPSTTVLGVALTTVRTSYLVASSSCNSRSACTQSEVSSPRTPKLLRRSPIKYARS